MYVFIYVYIHKKVKKYLKNQKFAEILQKK